MSVFVCPIRCNQLQLILRPRRITMTIISVQKAVSLLSAKITKLMTHPTLMSTKHLTRSPYTQQCLQISLRTPRNYQHKRLQWVHRNLTVIVYLPKVSSRAPRRDTFVDLVKYKFRRLEISTTWAVVRTSQPRRGMMKQS